MITERTRNNTSKWLCKTTKKTIQVRVKIHRTSSPSLPASTSCHFLSPFTRESGRLNLPPPSPHSAPQPPSTQSTSQPLHLTQPPLHLTSRNLHHPPSREPLPLRSTPHPPAPQFFQVFFTSNKKRKARIRDELSPASSSRKEKGR